LNPKSCDSKLGTIQAALLQCAGPLLCLWSELIDNDLLNNEDFVINIHNALSVVQRTLVLLGSLAPLTQFSPPEIISAENWVGSARLAIGQYHRYCTNNMGLEAPFADSI